MKFLNIPAFIISLALGIFLVYIGNPRPSVIYVYPTPQSALLVHSSSTQPLRQVK